MKNCFDRISRRKAYRMTGISADSVRQRVAQKLGDAPEEQERTRRRMKKRLFLSALVAALMFATAAAAGSGYLSYFFPTGISTFEKSVNTEPIECIFGGKWRATVTQTLNDENSTYIELKITGATEEAKAHLANFDNWELLHRIPMYEYLIGDEYIDGEFLKTEATNYHCGSFKEAEAEEDYIMTWIQITRPLSERKPITIQMEDPDTYDPYPESLTIPIKNPIGDKIVLTPNQKTVNYDGSAGIVIDFKAGKESNTIHAIKDIEKELLIKKLTITPLGLNIEYDASGYQMPPTPENCIFFEMADGTIYSSRHVVGTLSCSSHTADNTKNITATGNMREVKPLSAYKSIIIGTTAYPLDGGKPYQVTINPQLKPFLMTSIQKTITKVNALGESHQSTETWYPVKELCSKLGAQYSWDAAKQCAAITYCGDTLTLPLGETSFNTPGDPHPDTVNAELSNGTLIASRDLLFALRLTDSDTADKAVKIIYP